MSSNCCSTANGPAKSISTGNSALCPVCGAKGKPVSVLTVKSLVRDHAKVQATASFLFCRAPNCEVVYFAGQTVFRKPDLKVRVGIKETAAPIPVCYCFEYNQQDIRDDMETAGGASIVEKIKAEIQGGFCACEVKNPSGSCCLGDVTRAVQEARRAGDVHALTTHL